MRKRERMGCVCGTHRAKLAVHASALFPKTDPTREDNLAASFKRKRSASRVYTQNFSHLPFISFSEWNPFINRQRRKCELEKGRTKKRESYFIALLLHGLKNEMSLEDDADVAQG
jgi:hypothetical protein